MSDVVFYDDEHKYIETQSKRVHTSVTTLVKKYVEEFEQEMMAQKCSKKKDGKYAGMDPAEILRRWKAESLRATTHGTAYHEHQEQLILKYKTHRVRGVEVPVYPCMLIDGKKEALPQTNLKPGVYPEFIVSDKALGISGQVDKMMISADNILDIEDHKTNKIFKERGYLNNWTGQRKRLLAPLDHLEDSDSSIYALQMSIYAYLILRRNRHLKLGTLKINHVTFEKEGEDDLGFPIYKIDPMTGRAVVKEVRQIELPYLQREVIAMIKHWRKENKVQ